MNKSAAASDAILYIKKTYGDAPEFLWANSPNNGIFRHKGNRKWYAAILYIPKCKLISGEKGCVDILDLKCDPILVGSLIDNINIFPAYHMNKEHWISLLLDGSMDTEKLYALIDASYHLTKK